MYHIHCIIRQRNCQAERPLVLFTLRKCAYSYIIKICSLYTIVNNLFHVSTILLCYLLLKANKLNVTITVQTAVCFIDFRVSNIAFTFQMRARNQNAWVNVFIAVRCASQSLAAVEPRLNRVCLVCRHTCSMKRERYFGTDDSPTRIAFTAFLPQVHFRNAALMANATAFGPRDWAYEANQRLYCMFHIYPIGVSSTSWPGVTVWLYCGTRVMCLTRDERGTDTPSNLCRVHTLIEIRVPIGYQ